MKLIICFTVDEYREIENLTKKREESYKNKKGKWNRVYPAKSKTERATGFQAEFAVKFYLGSQANIETGDYSETEPQKVDVEFLGKNIAVRSTEEEKNNLLIRENEFIDIDYFIFCISKPRYTWLVGWTDFDNFEKNAYKFDPNNIGKPCYVLKKKYLFPIWKLRDMLNY